MTRIGQTAVVPIATKSNATNRVDAVSEVFADLGSTPNSSKLNLASFGAGFFLCYCCTKFVDGFVSVTVFAYICYEANEPNIAFNVTFTRIDSVETGSTR